MLGDERALKFRESIAIPIRGLLRREGFTGRKVFDLTEEILDVFVQALHTDREEHPSELFSECRC